MRGRRKLIASVAVAAALTLPMLMPTGAQAQLIGPLDLSGLLGTTGDLTGGGLLGVGGVGSEGGLLNSLLRDATLLNECGLPLLSGECRSDSPGDFDFRFDKDDFDFSDDDVFKFRRSNIFIDPFFGRHKDGRDHRDCRVRCDFDFGRHGGFHDGFTQCHLISCTSFGSRHSVPFFVGGNVPTIISNNNSSSSSSSAAAAGGGGGGFGGGGGGGASASSSSNGGSSTTLFVP